MVVEFNNYFNKFYNFESLIPEDKDNITRYISKNVKLDLPHQCDRKSSIENCLRNYLFAVCQDKNTDNDKIKRVTGFFLKNKIPMIQNPTKNKKDADENVFLEKVKQDNPIDSFWFRSGLRDLNLNIENHEDRDFLKKVATTLVNRKTPESYLWFKDWEIDSKDFLLGRYLLIEIAKIAAGQDGGGTSKYIQNYGLDPAKEEDKKALIEIAKIAAGQDGRLTSRYIKKYRLDPAKEEDNKALKEILKIAFLQDPIGAYWSITDYGLDFSDRESQILLKEILSLLFLQVLNVLPLDGIKKFVDLCDLATDSPELADFLLAYSSTDVKKMESIVNGAGEECPELRPLIQSQGKLSERNHVNSLLFIRYVFLNFKYEPPETLKEAIGPLLEIQKIQNPSLRFTLVNRLYKLLSDPLRQENFLSHWQKRNQAFKLPFIYCALFDMEPGQVEEMMNILQSRKMRNNGKTQRSLLDALEGLWKLSGIEPKDKGWLAAALFQGNFQELQNNCYVLTKAIDLGCGKALSRQSLESGSGSLREKLEQQFFQKIKELGPITIDEAGFFEKYDATIGKFRDPTALFVYLNRSIKKLPPVARAPQMKVFLECFQAIIGSNFQNWRYDTTLNPHLQQVFAGRNELEQDWKTGMESSFVEKQNSEDASLDLSSLIRQSFHDGHFSSREFPDLVECLQSQDQIKKNLDDKPKEQAGSLTGQEKKKIQFTLKIIQLMESRDPNISKSLLGSLIALKVADGQFAKDLEDWKKMLEGSSQQLGEKLKVVEGDDPCDLLLCGHEVLGSCQDFQGSPGLNKCLLGYLSNGQNRLILVRGENGKIQARALIRLLLRGDEPVLFLERLYPSNLSRQQKEAIEKLALEKAKKLKVSLYVLGDSSQTAGIKSLGGIAPFDYVDASDGIATDSTYIISKYKRFES